VSKQSRRDTPGPDERTQGHVEYPHPDRASLEHENRMATLFRQWPDLDADEMRELRQLWDECVGRSKRRNRAREDLAA
jgi:hypothetical protein